MSFMTLISIGNMMLEALRWHAESNTTRVERCWKGEGTHPAVQHTFQQKLEDRYFK